MKKSQSIIIIILNLIVGIEGFKKKNRYQSYKAIQMTTMIVSKTFIEHFKAKMLQRNPTYGYVQLLWLSWILHVMVGNRRIKIICPTFCFLVYAPLIMVCQVIDFFFFFFSF